MTEGCGSLMYGTSHSGRRIYKCGRYMKSVAKQCYSNAVDAEALLQFTLSFLAQCALPTGTRIKLRKKLCEMARTAEDTSRTDGMDCAKSLEMQLSNARETLTTTRRRLAQEKDDIIYQALRDEYTNALDEISELEAQHQEALRDSENQRGQTPQDEVEASMMLLDNIGRVAVDTEARAEILPLLERLGFRMGLNFRDSIKGKKRNIRKLASGVIVFGDNELPVKLHGSDRVDEDDSVGGGVKLKSAGKGEKDPVPADAHPSSCHRKGISITKVSRDDRN